MGTRTLPLVCAGALLAGCSGSSRTLPLSPGIVTAKEQAPHSLATLRVKITFPHPRPHAMDPRYMSRATKGISFAFSGASAFNATFSVTPGSKGCSTTGGVTKCVFNLRLATGKYHGTVSAYDMSPVGGKIPKNAHLLSTDANASFTIAGGTINRAGFVFDGVVKSISISGLPNATIGLPVLPAPFSVTAQDAAGNTIVGTYANPIKLSDTDTSGATTIATSGVDSPPANELLSSKDIATFSYSGAKIASTTITARATGAVRGSASFAPAKPGALTVAATCNAGADACANGTITTAGSVQFTATGDTATLTPGETPASTYTLKSDTCNKSDDPSAGGNWATLSPRPGSAAASFTVTAKKGGSNSTPSSCTAVLSDGSGQTVTIDIGVTVSNIGIN